MIVAETCLLLAIRDRLRQVLQLDDSQCDINLEDSIPAIASDRYVSICGAGVTTGERHSSSAGVWDLRIAAKVTIYHRIAEVARDRRRKTYADRLTGLNVDVGLAIETLDFSYSLLTAAQNLLPGTPAAGGNYPEPFREFSVDTNPRPVVQDYDVSPMNSQMGEPLIALARSITFRRARYMKERA
jgi:hypothetical protein